MTWDYLKSAKFYRRFDPIIDYLSGKTADKAIIDLDCGYSPILPFLDTDYGAYLGNDIIDDWGTDIEGTDKLVAFVKLTDVDFVDMIIRDGLEVDILLCLGMGGGDVRPEKAESATLRDSFLRIIKHGKPQIVITEGIQLWEQEYRYYSKLEADMPDYKRVEHHLIDCDPAWNDAVARREVRIYERITK